MLFGRDVAEHGGAVPSDHGCADGAGDVVVAGSDVGDQWAERVEGGLVAELDFFFDLLFDLVHGDVAGAFDHDLHVVLPGNLREFAESFEFGELGFVAGVGDAAGAEAVAEGEADVVLLENLDDVVEVFVEEILFVVVGHPLGEDGTAAADDAGDALGNQREILNQDAGVDGHVVHALLGLLFNDFEHDGGVQVFDALDAGNRLINRHGTDGHGRIAQDGFANGVDVAAGGKVHDGVGPVVDRGVQLLEFFFDLRRDRRIANIRINLAQRCHADRHWLEFGMVDVGGDDHSSAGHFVADELRRQLLFVGDEAHLFGDHALARVMHLAEIAGRIFFLAAGQPLCARLGDMFGMMTVAAVAVGSHDRTPRNSANKKFGESRLYPSERKLFEGGQRPRTRA